MAVLIRNIRIFDGETLLPGTGAVLVEGDRIAKVGTSADAFDAAGAAQVIEGEGRVLMPGLVDAHTHLALGSTVEVMGRPGNFPDEVLALTAAHGARVMLDHGFTSAYSGGSSSPAVEIALKAAIDKGASREEVLETMGMAIYMGAGPSVMYAAHAVAAFDQLSAGRATEAT